MPEKRSQLRGAVRIRTFAITAALLAAFFVVLPSAAFAADRYVDCDVPGNDSGGCTVGSECSTLQYAASQVAAGETVYVRGTCDVNGASLQTLVLDSFSHDNTTWTDWVGSPIIQNTGGDYGINLSSRTGVTFENFIFQGVDLHNVVISGGSGNILQYNVIRNATEDGVQVMDSSSNIIRNNSIYSNGTNGVEIYALGGMIADNEVRRNYIYSNGYSGIYIIGTSGRSTWYVVDTVVHNNILYNNSTDIGAGAAQISGSLSDGLELVHNTVADGDDSEGSEIELFGCENTYLRNNIIQPPSGGIGLYIFASATGWDSDNNLIYSSGGSADVGSWDGTPATSLGDWQSASGDDAASQDADPLLDGTYHILTGSPAEEEGTTSLPATFSGLDIDGQTRPMPVGTNYDQGADENGPEAGAVPEFSLLTMIVAFGLGLGTFGFVRHRGKAQS
ncbi:MAG: right-handed parallel beta-helix repeat-containing protein [Candidatus Kerfeldbacteria bacterium]